MKLPHLQPGLVLADSGPLMPSAAAAPWALLLAALVLLLFLQRRRLARELAGHRLALARLEETRDRLARASEEKSELMRMLVHDLRNPLTGFVMGANLLRAGGLNRDQYAVVERLRSNAASMARLIDDLLDADAIDSGQRRLRAASVEITRLLAETHERFIELAAPKALRLHLAQPPHRITIVSDEGALRQVIDNLLSNAVKYSPPGCLVQLALVESARAVTISVTDQGPGLDPEDLGRLFRKFSRGSARPTGGEKSHGLGLWIVKQVVTTLGGTVRCESEFGHGASFIVTLPVAARSASAPLPKGGPAGGGLNGPI